MVEEEAFHILKCEHFDEVQDAYDDALFEYKAKFLQQIPPLKLIEGIKKKIVRVNTAYQVFYPTDSNQEPNNSMVEIQSLDIFLVSYQATLSTLRLAITNALSGDQLLDDINKMIFHQTNLFRLLSECLDGEKLDLEQYPVKLSDEIDVFKVQLELKALGLDHTKISEYICDQINDLDFEEFAYITQAVINAKKQMIFNELRREI